MDYTIEPLEKKHIKGDFICKHESLQRYIREIAKQDSKRNLSSCFVLIGNNNNVLGYYTLSNTSILNESLPDRYRGSIGGYKNLPTTLIGRLAVDDLQKGKGLGKRLLMDALLRAYSVSKIVASYAVVVDYIDSEAKEFYRKFGFIELLDTNRLFLPMTTVKESITLS